MRERHEPKPQYKVTHIAQKDHNCNWCPRLIEKGTEYYQANATSRYHLECREEHQKGKDRAYVAVRERNHNPVTRLAYRFVTEILGQKWSWNSHKRYLAEAKCYVNPPIDPLTGEPQRVYTVETIMDCLNAIKSGHFGTPPERINSIHIVAKWRAPSGKSCLEDWLTIPPLPPTYLTMELQDWINRYGDRQESISENELEMLRAVAFGEAEVIDISR